MKLPSRLLVLMLASSIALGTSAQTQTPADTATPPSSDEVQPKFFIWGIVLNIAFKFAMGLFSDWLTTKLTTDLDNQTNMNRIMLSTAQAAVVSLSSATPFGTKSVGGPDNAVAGEPTKPVKVEDGKPNYQGVHVALVAFDKAGLPTRIQPITDGFTTGDRFKIKVLPTFDGLLVIENINPKGARSQIYPASPSEVISVKAGIEIFVPLAKDEFFEFAGETGDEQLVITLRDPRAFGDAASKAPANRKDEKFGSSFVQETPAGTFPVISQSIQLAHHK
jgi:hypothetical protein